MVVKENEAGIAPAACSDEVAFERSLARKCDRRPHNNINFGGHAELSASAQGRSLVRGTVADQLSHFRGI